MPETTQPTKPPRVINRLDAIFRKRDELAEELRRIVRPV